MVFGDGEEKSQATAIVDRYRSKRISRQQSQRRAKADSIHLHEKRSTKTAQHSAAPSLWKHIVKRKKKKKKIFLFILLVPIAALLAG